MFGASEDAVTWMSAPLLSALRMRPSWEWLNARRGLRTAAAPPSVHILN